MIGDDRSRPAVFLAVLAVLLSLVSPLWAMTPAAAVPAGSEYPSSWSVNGGTATGTTPSGVRVTATVSGAMQMQNAGDVIFSGNRPSYLPSTSSAALRIGAQNCTNTAQNGCGSITYTFSRPVKTPVVYVGDFGAGEPNPYYFSTYHDHPMTLASGTFSLDSSGSQTSRMGIWNSGRTVGVVNAQQYVNSYVSDTTSCGAFGCGAYDISTTTSTITSLTLNFGYEGSGTTLDLWGQILGITPATTSLSVSKSASPTQISAAGDTVTYSYQVTNTGEVAVTNPTINESSFSGTGTKPSASCPTGSVAPGSSVTCTVTYTATQADIDAGKITNTATATATPPSGMTAPVSSPSTATVTATQSPALTMNKTVAETGDLSAGQTLHYSFQVNNTGNVTLSGVKINETAFTGSGGTPTPSCPNYALAPGTSLTCTATYTVTQADVDNGSISNTATATGTPPNNGTPVTSGGSTAVVPFTAKPALTVVKTADKSNVVVGDVITYSVKVTNTGNVTMRNVTATDTTFSGSGTKPTLSCPSTSLAPGASLTCTGTYTVTQADVDSGAISNAATASGTPPNSSTPTTSSPGTNTVTTSQKPALTVTKSADRTDLVVGQTVIYTFKATNTGNVTLTGVTIKEGTFSGSGKMSAVSCPNGTLAPGASVTCTATYTVTQSDVDSGKLTNTATATGIPPGTTTPISSPPTPTTTVTGTQKPALTVAKSADRSDLVAGQTVTFTYKVTNTGNVTLYPVKINETAFSGSGTTPAPTCDNVALAPGTSLNCTATYTVTQADVDSGKLSNSATATGTPPNNGTPATSSPGTTTVTGTQKPALTVVKSADKMTLVLGDKITYTFKVTNTGNVTMKNISVTDSNFTGTGTLSAITCPSTSLAPNASANCTATYTVTQADVDAATLSNSATATGTPPNSSTPISPSTPSTTTIPGTRTPAMKVEKSADRTDLVAGQTVTYSFKVTNTGNVTLKNIAVQEGDFSGTGTMSAITCPSGASSLAPGAAVTCTATYTVTQADVDAGKLTNTATATGVPPGTTTPISAPPSPVNTVTGTQKPALTVTKAADKTKAAVGDVVTYSFLVTNTGNVTMSGVSVKEGSFSGSGTMSAISCPGGSLAPGASVTCTATYTMTQADVDAGKVTNSATVSATPPNSTTPTTSPPGTTTVSVDQKPSLKVEKSADRTDLVAGQTVTYSFLVTNTGNVTLKSIAVQEGQFSGTGTMSAITCPSGSLAPSASATCTATYTVTQADVDAGKLTNTATATGVPPNTTTPVTSPPTPTTTVTGTQKPGLTVVKTADRTDLVVGQTITYSFLATNTGNVTMTDITIDEGAFTGSGTVSAVSCPAAAKSLAPGASVTCTATYTVTQADVDAGQISNTATGSGVPPNSTTPVPSQPSTSKVPGTQTPALTVTKAADRTDLVVGQTVTYTFKATNTGNVTLTGVAVKEGDFSGTGTMSAVTCSTTTLAPGASATCTATYTVTQADVDAGKLTNTATATGVPPNTTTPISSPPTPVSTITGTQKPALTVTKAADKNSVVLGDVITYSFVVSNTGNVTMSDVAVQEGDFSGTGTMSAITCPGGPLAPGASVTCTATYTVTQADVDAGKITNSATTTAVPPNSTTPTSSPPGTNTVTTDQKPALKVEKSADQTDLVVGQTVTYSFKVTNTGNVTMKDIAVQEGQFSGTGTMSAITCPDGSLAPGASVTCTATYTVTQADVDAGKLTNTATATGVPPLGGDPIKAPPTPTSTVTGTQTPGLKVEKSVDKTDLVVGDTVTYSFKITNTGNVTMTDVGAKEGDFSGTGTMSAISCPAAASSLAPGAAVTCTATYTVTQDDVDAGKLTNSATPTGTPPNTTTPQDFPPGTTQLTGTQKPGLKVTKTADKTDLVVGDTLTYTFVATNTGNVTLKNVTVQEGEFSGTGKVSPIVCTDAAVSLAPGASVTCTATYTVTQADVDAGKLTNTATATGVPPNTTTPVTSPPTPTNTVTGTQTPGLKVEKTADRTELVAGQTITFSFKATNTGNVTLTDVAVQEGEFNGTGTLSAPNCPDAAKSLAPGASVTCTATYVVTQADVDAGQLANTATITGVPPLGGDPISSPPGTTKVPSDPKPGLSVVKSADKNALVLGETITYSFVVTNTGNVTMKDVTVQEGDFTGAGKLSEVSCPDGIKSIGPGTSVTCTATYKVVQEDVDAGNLSNSATVTGTPPNGTTPFTSPPGKTELPSPRKPALEVEKTASPDRSVKAGETITYSFLLINTGNVTLLDARPVETEFSGTGKVSAIDCPDGAAKLLPGQRVSCTATYQVTEADARSGNLTNAATGTAKVPGDGPPVVPTTSKVTVTTEPPAEPQLPDTGDEFNPLLIGLTVSLFAAGGGLLLAVRQRRRRES